MAEEGAVIGVHSVEEWSRQLEQAKESGKLIIVDFTASWCGPCRIIAPTFAELAKKFTNAIFLKVDVDELKVVSQEWNIAAMPTFLFLQDGHEVGDRIVGANKDGLNMKVTQLARYLAHVGLVLKLYLRWESCKLSLSSPSGRANVGSYRGDREVL